MDAIEKSTLNSRIEEYQKVLQQDPNNLDVLSNLGTCYASLNKTDKALEIFNKILNQNPKNLDALNNIGVVYTQIGKFEEAIEKLEIAVKLDSGTNAKYWNNLSEAYRRAGNYHKANISRMRSIQLNENK